MRLQRFKPLAAVVIICLTIGVFVWYVQAHPAILRQLSATNPWLVALLLILYVGFMASLVFIQLATLKLSKLAIPRRDNILLTIYSTIINFFGPLQSGPGFRGAYLQKRFGVSLKRYTAATLAYYGCFAFWSGLFIATALSWQWWLAAAGVTSLGMVILWRFAKDKLKALAAGWQIKTIGLLLMATLLQLVVVAIIYFFELRSFSQTVTFHQALIYTGAANFALFVSVTPGAIGFRESFVLFTQNLHHIPTATMVAASLLDRATYIVLLAILFVVTLLVHARERLSVTTPPSRPNAD